MSGHSDLGFFSNFGASSIFTWVLADTASAACPAQPGSLEMIACVLRDPHRLTRPAFEAHSGACKAIALLQSTHKQRALKPKGSADDTS